MRSASPYTLLVNSCDAFADCWDPFFTLFERYWPDCAAPVLLNTDRLTYEHPRVDVRSSRAARDDADGSVPAWGERTIRAVEAIETPQVLYVQEDYFLMGPVRTEWVDHFSRALASTDAACLRLLETHLSGPWRQTADDAVWEVERSAPYYAHLQAALWRREDLLALLRSHETAWDFELLGSIRAKRRKLRMLCVNRDRFTAPEDLVLPYEPTGIVKGKWVRERVEDLFAEHAIDVDFERRGWFTPPVVGHRSLAVKVGDRVRRLPTVLRSLR